MRHLIAALVLSLVAAMPARAVPLTWTVQSSGFGFLNGGVSGTFDFDAMTNAYSNIDLTIAGTGFGNLDGNYTFLFAGMPSDATTAFFARSAMPGGIDGILQLVFEDDPLTDAGGDFQFSGQNRISVLDCFATQNCTSLQSVDDSGGTYSADPPPAAPVPLPAGALLLLGGLAVLASTRRMRRAA